MGFLYQHSFLAIFESQHESLGPSLLLHRLHLVRLLLSSMFQVQIFLQICQSGLSHLVTYMCSFLYLLTGVLLAFSINVLIFLKSFIPSVSTPELTSTINGLIILIAASTLPASKPPARITFFLLIKLRLTSLQLNTVPFPPLYFPFGLSSRI